jgi:5'-nucleotidase
MRRLAVLAVLLAAGLGMLSVVPADAAKVHHVPVQLLAVNDFHGMLQPSEDAGGRPIGGAATLATYLAQAKHDAAEASGAQSLVLGGGDLIGASPPVSGLLHDEPAVQALGLMGLQYSTVGNHELDDGLANLLRLQQGGCFEDGQCVDRAPFQYLAANVVYHATGAPVLPPYTIEEISGVRIGLIGITSRQTPTIVAPKGIEGLDFLDEATTVNKYVRALQHKGVETIVVLINPGTDGSLEGVPASDLGRIVDAMDDAVDVVISGSSAQGGFNGTIDGKLVTQAYWDGIAYADIDLVLDRDSGDVVSKQANLVRTYGDIFPGSTPDPETQTLVESTTNLVAPLIDRVVGTAAATITREQSSAGESALGDLIADALRAKGGTQLAFVNPGSIRGDIAPGDVTWGDLFALEPFGNDVIRMTLTGAQLDQLLEQQWLNTPNRVLQVSGIEYAWSPFAPPGDRVAPEDIRIDGQPLDLDATYTVTTNAYLAAGGDNFSVFLDAANHEVVGGTDHDAFVEYVESLQQPFIATIEGRIRVK